MELMKIIFCSAQFQHNRRPSEMSNKKNETLKKVFRLTTSRKIAEIESDVKTNQENGQESGKKVRQTLNSKPKHQKCPSKSVNKESHDQNKIKSNNQLEEINEDEPAVESGEIADMQDGSYSPEF